ncbi:MAG: hypothetical protein AAF845_11735 [Bacteroidota bacterium]
MSARLSCCVDVPSEAAGLVRYGLEELLRGLGLAPAWTRRGDARLTIRLDAVEEGLDLRLGPEAVDALVRPTPPVRMAEVEIDGERWPLPASGPEAGPEAGDGDLVASAAWWLAGLQEHATAERDAHGRFPFAASLQARLGEAPGGPLRPAVDAYRRRLGDVLRAAGVEVLGQTWGGAPWAVALTHDLDALRTRRLRALAGDLLRRRPVSAVRRALGPDLRRRSVADLRALADRLGVRATYFAKPGAWAPEDANAPLGPSEAALLRSLAADGHEVGWHPGYGAHDRADRLGAEHARLTEAVGHAPALARTHFLRWTEPQTPRLLAEAGVRIDSTLGFSAHEGFRRGTSHPFRIYDRDADRPADLWEMPLAVMDTTLFTHRGLGPEAAAEALAQAFEAARLGGGCAVVLWHNDLGEGAPWSERLPVLEQALRQARDDGAAVGALGALRDVWCSPEP